MAENELGWWYWLSSVKWLGPAYIRMLLDVFGHPRRIYEASLDELQKKVKLPARVWVTLANSKNTSFRYEKFSDQQAKTAELMGARILTLLDPDYPEFLRAQTKQAPPLLHVQGDLSLIRPRAVAVVGTRAPSFEAVERTRVFAKSLCEHGHPIVAGMARGIDTTAHSSALQYRGMTIAVLGCGLDRIYPPENALIYAETRKRGLLVSQFPFGSSPSPDNLRQRNKLIVALSDAVVVAESGVPGGALIAARAALEQHKNLFVFSWQNMDLPSRAGTRRLLESNLARPVDDDKVESVFELVSPEPSFSLETAWNNTFSTFGKKLANRDKTPQARGRMKGKASKKTVSQSVLMSTEPISDPSAQNTSDLEASYFSKGDKVSHINHGFGKVTNVITENSGIRIVVLFAKGNMTSSLPLEIAKTQLIKK